LSMKILSRSALCSLKNTQTPTPPVPQERWRF